MEINNLKIVRNILDLMKTGDGSTVAVRQGSCEKSYRQEGANL
jgi:hypothetical protein